MKGGDFEARDAPTEHRARSQSEISLKVGIYREKVSAVSSLVDSRLIDCADSSVSS